MGVEPKFIVGRLWRTKVPSKIKIFGWRMLLDTTQTRDQLDRGGIIHNVHEKVCAYKFKEEESLFHLFFQCKIVMQVWDHML